jgi:membrane protein DedA with SNARE-associated domain
MSVPRTHSRLYDWLAAHAPACFVLMSLSFVVFGLLSLDLVRLVSANAGFLLRAGWDGLLADGGLVQLLELSLSALAAAHGLNVWILLPLFLGAAWLGSLLAYVVGRWLGEQARARNPRWLNREALANAQRFFDGYGGLGLLVSPYVAVLRTFAPLAAGIARMAPARFVAAAGGGAALWSIGLVGSGYFFGNVPLVREHMGSLILAGLLLGLAGLLLRARRR